MKTIDSLIVAGSLLAFATIGHAQTKPDEDALRRLPVAWSEAWAKRDGHQLAQLVTEDVDFINVGAFWLHGRRDFEILHTKLLSQRFKDSVLLPLETAVVFLRPDLALVRWSWSMKGDKNPDGSLRNPRFGLVTLVTEKRDGKWLIIAGQNTNSAPGKFQEMDGIVMPIVVPPSL